MRFGNPQQPFMTFAGLFYLYYYHLIITCHQYYHTSRRRPKTSPGLVLDIFFYKTLILKVESTLFPAITGSDFGGTFESHLSRSRDCFYSDQATLSSASHRSRPSRTPCRRTSRKYVASTETRFTQVCPAN